MDARRSGIGAVSLKKRTAFSNLLGTIVKRNGSYVAYRRLVLSSFRMAAYALGQRRHHRKQNFSALHV